MNASKIQPYFLFTLLLGSALLAFFIFKPFLIPLSLAAIFATVLYPLYERILKLLRKNRGASALITLIIACACVLTPLFFIGAKVISQAETAYSSLAQSDTEQVLGSVVLKTGASLEGIFPGATLLASKIASDIQAYISQGLSWMLAHAGGAFSSVLGIGLDLFIFLFALYFFIKDGPKISAVIIKVSPFADTDDKHIITRLSLTINSVVKGSLVVAVVQGTLACIGFTIFGVPNSVLWGTLTAFAALVPGVGTSLVLLPAIVYLFIVGVPVHAFGLLIWALVAVGLVDNFIGPRLIGRGIHMPQLVIMLSVLGGVAYFGPAGIFLGPLCISLLVALFSIYSDKLQA